MTSFVKPMQNFMQTLPFYGNYQNIGEQSAPLYHQQGAPVPNYQQPTAYDPKAPIYATKPVQYSPSISKARQLFTKFRRYLKIVAFISNLISAGLSFLMLGQMGYMTVMYLGTKDKSRPDGKGGVLQPWDADTKTWPTYMLLTASTVTCFGSLIQVLRCCCSSRTKTMFSVLYYLVHFGIWAGIAVAYRLGKTGKDLWGWSCDMEGGPRAKLFQDVLNYEQMCNIQVCSYDRFLQSNLAY